MNADVHGSAQREYLDGLRAELADLPAPEVGEILDDVGAHLAEVGSELGPDADLAALTARLGTPQAYAVELRAAAGYPVAPRIPAAAGDGPARFALVALLGSTGLVLLGSVGILVGDRAGLGLVPLALLVAMVSLPVVWRGGPRMAAVAALPSVRRAAASAPDPDSAAGKLAGFGASLQPAWWLLRGALAAVVVVALFLGRPGAGPVLLLALLFAPVSVWLGYRSRPTGGCCGSSCPSTRSRWSSRCSRPSRTRCWVRRADRRRRPPRTSPACSRTASGASRTSGPSTRPGCR